MLQWVKNPPANAEDTGDVSLTPESGRSPGGGNGSHSSVLVWAVPRTEEPGGLQPMGSQRVRQAWAAKHCPCVSRSQALPHAAPSCWCRLRLALLYLHLSQSTLHVDHGPPRHHFNQIIPECTLRNLSNKRSLQALREVRKFPLIALLWEIAEDIKKKKFLSRK